MKKSKLLSILSLGLIASFSLSACSPASVTPEEGKQVLQEMKKAYENNEVESKNQFRLRETVKTSLKTATTTVESEVSTIVMLDLDKVASYSLVEAKDSTVETWAYLDGDNFITAFKSNDFARYTSVKTNPELVKDLLLEVESVEDLLSNTGIEAVNQLDEAIKEFDGINEEFTHQAFGAKAEGKVEAEFRSNKAGQLHFITTAEFAHAQVEENLFTVDIKAKNKIAVDDYTLSEIESEVNMTSEIADQKYSSNTYSRMRIDNKAKIKLPNLDNFKKGAFDLPEIDL